jgi:hypothetical protein
MKTSILSALLGAATLVLASSPARAHGCHAESAFDRIGWHHHVGQRCVRVDDAPPRHLRPRDGDYERKNHRRYYEEEPRPPECVKKCKYIGPFKTCDYICR